MLRSLSDDGRTVSIGEDQTGIMRKNLERNMLRGREKQTIAVLPIVRPFLIDAKVLNRGLDLHDPEFAIATESDEVGPPA